MKYNPDITSKAFNMKFYDILNLLILNNFKIEEEIVEKINRMEDEMSYRLLNSIVSTDYIVRNELEYAVNNENLRKVRILLSGNLNKDKDFQSSLTRYAIQEYNIKSHFYATFLDLVLEKNIYISEEGLEDANKNKYIDDYLYKIILDRHNHQV